MAEARKWMNEPNRRNRRLKHRIQESESIQQRRQLEADVKAANEEIAFETAAEVTVNESDIEALCEAYSAMKTGDNMSATKLRSGLDIRITHLTPPMSSSTASASTPSTPSSSSSSYSAGDTLPSSPASAASVKRTSATPSR